MNLKEAEKRMAKLGFYKCDVFGIDNGIIDYNELISFDVFRNENKNITVDFFGNEDLSKIYFYCVGLYDFKLTSAWDLEGLYELRDETNESIKAINETRKLISDNFKELYDASEKKDFEYAVDKFGKIIDEELKSKEE